MAVRCVFWRLRMFGELTARSGRRAERTGAYSDRADRPNPNIVFSQRDSYQRRGHLTVSEVESYRLTLPRSTRQGQPNNYISAQRDMMEDLKHGFFCF